MTVPISAVILTRNEAENIVRCLQSLDWVDEILVVDDGSTDDTVSLAKASGARVVDHAFESFAKQRNWVLNEGQLRNEWVLMLDADETSDDDFAAAVKTATENADQDVVAFRTCRKTMLCGTWLKHSDSFPVWIMRLVRKGQADFEDSGHGEVPVPPVDGKIGTIPTPFIHYPFSRGLNDWWQRHIRYAEKEARKEIEQAKGTSGLGVFSLNRSHRRAALRQLSRSMPARGVLRFLYQYVVKLGFMDGKAGLQFCRLMAQYEQMIVIKSWELQAKNDEMKTTSQPADQINRSPETK